ncbi:Polyadenylate-binding protein 7 [Linum perenne]
MEATNHRVINGKAIRVMESQSNWDSQNIGIGNIFVKNLQDFIDNAKLEGIFSKYGKITSCKVMVTEEGKSKGYGFVQFESPESALRAIESVNDTVVDGKKLYVSKFKKKEERFGQEKSDEYFNLYFKNLDESVTEEILRAKFSEFGEITSFLIVKDDDGKLKGFGFINFAESKAARQARDSMDGTLLGSKALYVARAQTKSERQQFLRQKSEQLKNEWLQKHKNCNLYVKNISDEVDDTQLGAYFAAMGRVVTSKIMRMEKGISKGYGFVCFSTPEEATKSVAILNGTMFHGKPLYVAIAQTKEERRQFLNSVYSKKQSTTLTPLPFPASPFYFPSSPFFRQPSFQPRFPVLPSFLFRPPPPMLPNYIPAAPFQRPIFENRPPPTNPKQDWSSDLAAASPRHRKDMIWDRLFPLVQKLKGDAANTITQMLMEKLDNVELLVLLESPASLAAKVDESEDVLRKTTSNAK